MRKALSLHREKERRSLEPGHSLPPFHDAILLSVGPNVSLPLNENRAVRHCKCKWLTATHIFPTHEGHHRTFSLKMAQAKAAEARLESRIETRKGAFFDVVRGCRGGCRAV